LFEKWTFVVVVVDSTVGDVLDSDAALVAVV
jgi:hypothetical protein